MRVVMRLGLMCLLLLSWLGRMPARRRLAVWSFFFFLWVSFGGLRFGAISGFIPGFLDRLFDTVSNV
jgi:hypothetical protein